jgi:hypothetical protein
MVGFTDLLASTCLWPAVYGASSTYKRANNQFTIPVSGLR